MVDDVALSHGGSPSIANLLLGALAGLTMALGGGLVASYGSDLDEHKRITREELSIQRGIIEGLVVSLAECRSDYRHYAADTEYWKRKIEENSTRIGELYNRLLRSSKSVSGVAKKLGDLTE